MLSCVQLFVTLWSVAYQAPLAIEFSRQEYWIRVPFSPPEDLLHLEIESTSLMPPPLQVDSLPPGHLGSP